MLFWSGNGLPTSAVADWQRSFRRVSKLTGLERPDGSARRCFPLMLRDTFAVEMLVAGEGIDQVSMLIGHASVKITEKHYFSLGQSRPRSTRGECSKTRGVLWTPFPQRLRNTGKQS
ncbi:tyrosine-type recombinase/integrase [Tunturiibacter psychrotolerans]|uniref:tyrosine-type recombinase/integrase n=1 Tax=Tunturiibacter psychrotolerans TaxID=3069686 RepID=UPI003D226C3D